MNFTFLQTPCSKYSQNISSSPGLALICRKFILDVNELSGNFCLLTSQKWVQAFFSRLLTSAGFRYVTSIKIAKLNISNDEITQKNIDY